jgi:hypothetical protein
MASTLPFSTVTVILCGKGKAKQNVSTLALNPQHSPVSYQQQYTPTECFIYATISNRNVKAKNNEMNKPVSEVIKNKPKFK